MDAIKAALTPLEINLGSQNMRSPDSQIAEFGQDIMARRVRTGGYKGVSSLPFNRGSDLGNTLRRARAAYSERSGRRQRNGPRPLRFWFRAQQKRRRFR